jgi:hypothetical protein
LSKSKLELCGKPIRVNKVKSLKMGVVCGGVCF